jgi:excisionase family DNA binding protein
MNRTQFPGDESKAYCGTSEAARMLNLSVGTVQSLVERRVLEGWKTEGGHRRILLSSIDRYRSQVIGPGRPIPFDAERKGRFGVLLAHQDADWLARTQEAIRRWSWPVMCQTAPSGSDTLKELALARYDLLVMDASLPEPEGMALLRGPRSLLMMKDTQLVLLAEPDSLGALNLSPWTARVCVRTKPMTEAWLEGFALGMRLTRDNLKTAGLQHD